jgi:hypothetical protein
MRSTLLPGMWAIACASLAGACQVIDPSLLGNDARAIDSRPADARLIDAEVADASPPDAYVPFEGNLVDNPGVELGLIDWTTNGGSAQIAVTTAQAHGGTNSLLTTNRTDAWNGPAVDLTTTIRPGRRYTATMWMRTNTGAGAADFYVSVRHTCGVTQEFNFQNNRTLAAGGETDWVQVSSNFRVITLEICNLTEFLVYAETNVGTPEILVDDIEVLEVVE